MSDILSGIRDFIVVVFAVVTTTVSVVLPFDKPSPSPTPVAEVNQGAIVTPPASIIKTKDIQEDRQDTSIPGSPSLNPPHEAYSEYRYKDWQVNVKALIPYDAGNVTGSVIVRDIQSAITRCTGEITGTYDGKEEGQAHGEINGSCKISFLTGEFNATYTGKVYREKGEMPLDFALKAIGFEKSGNVTLYFTPFE